MRRGASEIVHLIMTGPRTRRWTWRLIELRHRILVESFCAGLVVFSPPPTFPQ